MSLPAGCENKLITWPVSLPNWNDCHQILDESNRLSGFTAYSMVILCHIDQVKPRQSRQEHKSRKWLNWPREQLSLIKDYSKKFNHQCVGWVWSSKSPLRWETVSWSFMYLFQTIMKWLSDWFTRSDRKQTNSLKCLWRKFWSKYRASYLCMLYGRIRRLLRM